MDRVIFLEREGRWGFGARFSEVDFQNTGQFLNKPVGMEGGEDLGPSEAGWPGGLRGSLRSPGTALQGGV